jgi:hypothetical protein
VGGKPPEQVVAMDIGGSFLCSREQLSGLMQKRVMALSQMR